MSEIKWIKIVTDIFDDEKILLIESMPDADALIVIWFKLLCLAGKQNNSGVFVLSGRMPYTDEMFATIFRRPINTVRLALKTFENLGMIEIINKTVTIPNWEKHQKLDQFEASKEATRERVARYREKQKLLIDSNVTCNVTDDVTVTSSNADRIDKNRLDKNREDEIREDKSVTRGGKPRFTPPTADEVRAYCDERHNTVDADRFVDFYSAKGWKVGNQSMKDWRAAVRTWERNDSSRTDARPTKPKSSNPFLDMLKGKDTVEVEVEEGGYPF